ncbi:hypothetical protein [Chitinibacter sp. ZOR0017]|uniref:hypothetical protein n=1 Tax=Chitinibacter sp. ZOR0017 TaxID=1339254 RepID=UPI0006472DAF|nr:hypothetical protein [Chitinibacter sp. ZOR0017]
MSLLKAFKAGVGSVVIIDDLYLAPNPETINGDALAIFYKELKASPDNCAALSALLEIQSTNPEVLLNATNESLSKIYNAHLAGQHHFLQSLFVDLDEQHTAELRRLRNLEQVVTEYFGVTPKTFGSLEDARADLNACSVVFIDFFLEGVSNHEEARLHHKAISDELATKIVIDEESFPKVIVLMSTSLPAPNELALFRKDTGVRGAFFHTMDKADFSPAEIESHLKEFVESYESAKQLSGYLDTIEHEISAAATSLKIELRSRLDVHDLTILKTLRLDGESDTPQSYLTLLLSEALAARVRMAKGLQEEVLPEGHAYGDAPFDGKLLPSSVLFELFADIAVAPTPTSDNIKIAFGDVLESLEEHSKGKLFLAISPACDLQRCQLDYEVLFIPGNIIESNADLSTLIDSSYKFGQGGLVLKLPSAEDGFSYSKIKFEYKLLKTLPVSAAQNNQKYRRVARLTEVFAQELKTLALNHTARVGVPIDPSFSIGLKVKVRYHFTADKQGEPVVTGEFDADGSEFLPAVLAMGRQLGDSDLNPTVMFSRQFKAKLQKALAEKHDQQNNKKLKVIENHFANPESYKVALDRNSRGKTLLNGQIVIKYSAKLPQLGQPKNFEIHLYSEVEGDQPAEEGEL